MKNSKYSDILMTNVDEKGLTREEMFQEFFDTEPPYVMVSASMGLGVDLRGDRCRWQLICKTPYPPLGDPQINKRVKMDQGWYSWQTLMALIQTYGRGVRSETDWCKTYVLDSTAESLIQRTRRMMPKWFLEAIKYTDLNVMG